METGQCAESGAVRIRTLHNPSAEFSTPRTQKKAPAGFLGGEGMPGLLVLGYRKRWGTPLYLINAH